MEARSLCVSLLTQEIKFNQTNSFCLVISQIHILVMQLLFVFENHPQFCSKVQSLDVYHFDSSINSEIYNLYPSDLLRFLQ